MSEMILNKLPERTWSWLGMNETKTILKNNFLKNEDTKSKTIANENKNTKKESALGTDFLLFLEENHSRHETITLQKNILENEPLVITINVQNKSSTLNYLTINVKENINASVIVRFVQNSSVNKNSNTTNKDEQDALNAFRVDIHAARGANINFSTVQLLESNTLHFNDVYFFPEQDAQISFYQIELGAKNSFIGFYADLKNPFSKIKTKTAYICASGQTIDMNFIARHNGKNTTSTMEMNGSLKEDAKKIFRGTIDFKNGCKGAVGKETENTLILSKEAQNKSIPLILCDEEDVQGEHGASIGRISDDVMFYMMSRGLDKNSVEKMLTFSKIFDVASNIKSEETKKMIRDFLSEDLEDF